MIIGLRLGNALVEDESGLPSSKESVLSDYEIDNPEVPVALRAIGLASK